MLLRSSPSGPPLYGTAIGQVLTWDGTEWMPGAAAGSPFDFVLASRADLVAVVAPVAGVFILPSGSYALTASFALGALEAMQVPVGNTVVIAGLGHAIAGGGTAFAGALLVVAGTCSMQGLTLQPATLGQDPLLVSTGALVAITCAFLGGTGSSSVQTGGTINAQLCTFGGGAFGLDHQGGTCRLSSCTLTSGGGGYRQSSAGTPLGNLIGCDVEGGTGSACLLAAALGTLSLSGTVCRATAANANAVTITACANLLVGGGRMLSTSGTPGDGISIAGAVTGTVDVVGVKFSSLDDCLAWASGVVSRANFSSCDADATCTTLVDWTAANIPTLGLIEGGNAIVNTTANAFIGHTAASARVSRRANLSTTGPMPESAIVP